MSLRETLEAWPHARLVKELHAHAKRNAARDLRKKLSDGVQP